uniref:EF-hand domain-containing protein n=1 Tax=Salix viminalis TaxID=40686 RepID=A0A6N2KQI8_SALVM
MGIDILTWMNLWIAIIECGSKEDELMDAFLIFDVDKNGFISAKELHAKLDKDIWKWACRFPRVQINDIAEISMFI